MDKPEQWAVELWEQCALADLYYTPVEAPDPMQTPAGTIQRAFEERERAIVKAILDKLHHELPYPTEACALVRIAYREGLKP